MEMIYGDSVFGEEEEEVHVPVPPPAVVTRNDDDSVQVVCSSDDDSFCSEEEMVHVPAPAVKTNGSTVLGNKRTEKRMREESSSMRLFDTRTSPSLPSSKRHQLSSSPLNHSTSCWCDPINEHNDDEMLKASTAKVSKLSETNKRKVTGAAHQPKPQEHSSSKNEEQPINGSRKQERKRFDECHKCDICNMHDGYKMLNMQQCRTCRMYVHEKCYGLQPKQELEQLSVKYADWECYACSSVGNTIITKKKHHRPKKTIIKQRPFKCALCPVESTLHAMHPLYDVGGVDGQPLIENDEAVWVHTLCAYTITTAFRGGLVYGCDEKGMCEWSSDDEDDEDSNNQSSAEQHQEPEFYDFRYFDSRRKRKLVYTPAAHHFVIATKTDGATKDCLKAKKEAQQLRCFICGKDSVQNKNIPIQCKNKDCCVASHVGCAKWGHNNDTKNYEYVKYCCIEEESEFYCNRHLKLKNETLSSNIRKIGELEDSNMRIIPSTQAVQSTKMGKGSLSDMYEQRKKGRKNLNSKYQEEARRKPLTNVENRLLQTSNNRYTCSEMKQQKKINDEQNLKKKSNDDAANSTDTSKFQRRSEGDNDHSRKRKNCNPKSIVKTTTTPTSVLNQTATLQNTPKVSKLLNNTISKSSRHNKDKQEIKERRLKLSNLIKLKGASSSNMTNKQLKSILKRSCPTIPPNRKSFSLQSLTKRRIHFSSPEVSARFSYPIMDDEDISETLCNDKEANTSMLLSHVKEATKSRPRIKPNVVGQAKSQNDGCSSSTSNELLNYALHGSMKEMIACLRNGSSTQKQDIKETIKSMKQMMENLEGDQDKKEGIKVLDLHLKKNALKIFKNAEAITDIAIKLNGDRRKIERNFTIKVVCLNNFSLSNEAKQKMEKYDLCIECSGKRTILSKGNAVSFQSQKSITFERDCQIHFQAPYSRDIKEQKVIIRLLMVSKKEFDSKPIFLGVWQLYLNDVHGQITPQSPQSYSDEGSFLKKKLSKKLIHSAKMRIDVSVIDYNEDYFQPKRLMCSELLDEACRAIEKFQEHSQAQEDNEPIVDSNITCFEKISLLDAAVILYDLKIIHKLLHLGADMSSKSSVWGTSLDLAKHIHKHACGKGDEKLQKCFQDVIQYLESYKNDQIIIEKCFQNSIMNLNKDQPVQAFQNKRK